MFTISWLLSSICCLMDAKEFVVKVGIPRGTYLTPPYSYAIRPRLFMEDLDVKCEFRGNAIISALSANNEAWLCNPAIMAVGMPYG